MSDYKDNYGAEVVMRVTCQRCGKTIYRKQIGYCNMDAAVANRHSLLDQFEHIPDGWKINHAINGWCCPECYEEYNIMVENFKASGLSKDVIE